MIVTTREGAKWHDSPNGVVTFCGREVDHIWPTVIRNVPTMAMVDGKLVESGEVRDFHLEVTCERCLAGA
jgi:hypothetical protein